MSQPEPDAATAPTPLTARQFQQQEGLTDWRVLGVGASAWFGAASHADAARLVSRLAPTLDADRPPPDLDLRADGIRVRVPALPDAGGLTTDDAVTARAVSVAAAELGMTADPAALQDVQLAMDVLDPAAVMPFWQEVLGYLPAGEEDLVDAGRRDPAIWFQDQDAPRPLRNRVHLDVLRPALDESARQALTTRARGGQVTGPYGLTLADAEGNEVDVVPAGEDWAQRPELADWSLIFGAMVHYPTASLAQAAALVEAVAALADDAGVQLLVDVRPGGVTLDSGKDVWEHDDSFEGLAVAVQAAARGLGLVADPQALRFVQIGLDAADIPALQTFWRAALGYVDDPRQALGVTDIYDPRRLGPVLFFQDLGDEPERAAQRNRIHVDVFVPDDQARARVEAAVAAGGRVVRDEGAPAWWTIADPEGNELDIAVSVGREESWAAQRAEG